MELKIIRTIGICNWKRYYDALCYLRFGVSAAHSKASQKPGAPPSAHLVFQRQVLLSWNSSTTSTISFEPDRSYKALKNGSPRALSVLWEMATKDCLPPHCCPKHREINTRRMIPCRKSLARFFRVNALSKGILLPVPVSRNRQQSKEKYEATIQHHFAIEKCFFVNATNAHDYQVLPVHVSF